MRQHFALALLEGATVNSKGRFEPIYLVILLMVCAAELSVNPPANPVLVETKVLRLSPEAFLIRVT
jgi:hypothetical protein